MARGLWGLGDSRTLGLGALATLGFFGFSVVWGSGHVHGF